MSNNSSLFGDFITDNPQKSNRPGKKWMEKLIFLGAVCSVILLSVGAGSHYLVPQAQKNKQVNPAVPAVLQSSTSAQQSTPVASEAAAPEVVDEETGLSKTALSVTVQNGSGELGVGIKASEVLKTAGYSVASIGNAPTFNYTDITIVVKSAKKAYLLLLKRDLAKEYVVSSTSATLDKNFPSDAVVVVGREK